MVVKAQVFVPLGWHDQYLLAALCLKQLLLILCMYIRKCRSIDVHHLIPTYNYIWCIRAWWYKFFMKVVIFTFIDFRTWNSIFTFQNKKIVLLSNVMRLVEFRYVLMFLVRTKTFNFYMWQLKDWWKCFTWNHEVEDHTIAYGKAPYISFNILCLEYWHETVSNLNQFEKNGIQIGGECIANFLMNTMLKK
jgi:hypothetical protein